MGQLLAILGDHRDSDEGAWMRANSTKGPRHHLTGLVLALLCSLSLGSFAQKESSDPIESDPTAAAAPKTTVENPADAVVIDMRNALDARPSPGPVAESSLVLEYQAAIEAQERLGGAYSPGMTEQLLGLGTALQQLNRHEEAIDVLKRGAHIARINNGLYSGEQLALLRSEIRSHMAMGQFDQVDERQRYLYRVERRSLANRSDSAEALMRQAQWQQQAFLMRVGDPETQTGRLMVTWDLYRLALTEMIEVHGNSAPQLRRPLMGMLTSQYLFAGHRGYPYYKASKDSDAQLAGLTSTAYKRGVAVLNALLELDTANDVSLEQQAQDTVALGDWAMWFGKFSEAEIHYATAMGLIEGGEQPELMARFFAQPVPLPAIESLDPLPPYMNSDQGPLAVSFSVTETGRVKEFEELLRPELEDDKAVRRLVRTLKDTRFRPGFDGSQPVASEGLIWSFSATAWDPETVLLD